MATIPRGLPIELPEDVVLTADEREILERLEDFLRMVEDGSIKELPPVREQLREHIDRLNG